MAVSLITLAVWIGARVVVVGLQGSEFLPLGCLRAGRVRCRSVLGSEGPKGWPGVLLADWPRYLVYLWRAGSAGAAVGRGPPRLVAAGPRGRLDLPLREHDARLNPFPAGLDGQAGPKGEILFHGVAAQTLWPRSLVGGPRKVPEETRTPAILEVKCAGGRATAAEEGLVTRAAVGGVVEEEAPH